ncbi:MAG: hypothetical protein JXD19_08920 [Deltaproteobacteria bacterium]|nr:hypothetical protein [Deltaproteobacteria bacterium]
MNHYLVVMFNLNIPRESLSEVHTSSLSPSSPKIEKCRSLKEAQDLAERYKERFERIRIYSLEKKINVIEEFLYGTRYHFRDLDSSES